jgi:NADH-quinone oxidoreductase subunit N
MNLTELWQHCGAIVPELILSLAICAVILADMFAPLPRSRMVCHAVSVAGVLWALAVVAGSYGTPHASNFLGMIASDGLAQILRLLILLGTLGTLLFSVRSRELAGYRQGEYYSLLLGAVLGALFLVAADNWVMLVLGLETLSLCSYVLAGFVKHERRSAEAGLKYMIYGAVTSGVMLFGISYIYGMTGTLAMGDGMRALTAGDWLGRPVFLLALLLVLAGLGFKMAMVPFQFWAPDVYQGAPTPVTAFLAVVSKTAGFGALMRITWPLFQSLAVPPEALALLFGLLAAITMTFGNLTAMRQTDVKRLLAYSSIAHAGYLLMGMTVFKPEAFQAMLAYFFIYLVMNLGAFWVLIAVVNRVGSPEIKSFRGLFYTHPWLFWTMFIFLISLTGVPPTAGFMAKLILFGVVIQAGLGAMAGGALTPWASFYFILALVGVINSVFSLYYYMKIAKAMAFQSPEAGAPTPAVDWLDNAYAVCLAVPTLALLYIVPVLRLVDVL